MKKVIIGCGYVGYALAKLWQGEGLTMTTTTLSKVSELKKLGHVTVLNISEEETLRVVLKDADCVVVCIAPKDKNYDIYPQTAKMICRLIPKSAHLIYTSSSSVYGDQNGNWVNETSKLSGKSHLIKAEALYLEHPVLTILRLAGIYGPSRELEVFAKRIAGSEQTDSYSNLIFLNDIVRAIDFVYEKSLTGIFNLCSDHHPKRSELYDPIIKDLNLSSVQWKPGSTIFGNKRVENKKIKEAGFSFNE